MILQSILWESRTTQNLFYFNLFVKNQQNFLRYISLFERLYEIRKGVFVLILLIYLKKFSL